RSLMQRFGGIHAERPLPAFASKTFLSWFKAHLPLSPEALEGRERTPRGDAVLFHDTFTDYFHPEVGEAAVRVLEALGYSVVLAEKAGCCGRPAISKGMLDDARRLASENVETLHPYVREGIPIVGCEPSCILSLRDEYPDLVPGEKARELARGSFLLEELLLHENLPLRAAAGPILLHGHCHLKALVGMEPLVSFLKKLGGEVSLVESGCCGMAGSFGYEKEHYEISLQMAERRLAPAAREAPESTTIVAPGTSCRHQIHDTAGRRALHPAEVAARAMGLS
ncbi:MAG TPA: heterodisulfide reductase-related iron-sulfur binding cluster, partial [Vicinamibacteria bacterium]